MTVPAFRADVALDLETMRGWFGVGVAGNVAGHLEQAGEAASFAAGGPTGAPKGIFPWYVPGADGPLGRFPLSHDTLRVPVRDGAPLRLQGEPEVALACHVRWDGDRVRALRPFALGAFDDCSIRIADARLLSDKKNWGAASKGVATHFFALDGADALRRGGSCDALRLRSTWRGAGDDGHSEDYGVDTPLAEYTYFGDELLDWLVERLGAQRGGCGSGLEDVGALMVAAGRPEVALVAVGATRYTAFGATAALRPGDRLTVAVVDTVTGERSEVCQVLTAG